MINEDELESDYLAENPALECSLWVDWTQVVCRRMGIAVPTAREWDALQKTWYHGKTPLASADELVEMRRT